MRSLIKNIFASLSRGEMRALFAAITIALIAAIGLAAITVTKGTTVAPATGGDYTEGAVGQPISINPVLAETFVDQSLVRLVFSNITSLEDNIQTNDGGRTWTVRLKENIRWQDGEKVTSDDVIFTVAKTEESDAHSPLAPSWQGILVERLSELELKFTLPAPYAFFKENLDNLYVLPKHLFADIPPPNWHLSDYNLKPIGSGPYAFSSYQKRSDGFITSYALTANPTYFGDKQFLKTMTFDFFTQKGELLRAFNSGRVDGMSVEPDDLASLERPYNAIAYPVPNYYAVFWNQTRNPALADKNVRRALSLSIDRAKIASDIFGASGIPAWGPLPPGFVSPTSTQATASFSLEEASNTLTKAGWIFGTEGGVREKTVNKQNIPLSFTLTVPDIGFLTRTASDLQSAWQTLGVKITIRVEPPEITRDTVVKNRDYEALLFGNLLDKNYDLFSFWHSSERFSPGLDLALYANPRADALIESIRKNLDATSRTMQFSNLEDMISGDYPAAFLYWSPYLSVAGKDIQGITPEIIVNPADRFLSVPHWYVKTARVLK